MAAVCTAKALYIAVANVLQAQVAGLAVQAHDLPLPPAVVGVVRPAVSGAGTAVGAQLHKAAVQLPGIVQRDVNGRLVDAGHHGAAHHGLQRVHMAAGVGAGTHALGGQGLQPPADDLLGAVRPAKMKEFERQKTTDFSFVRRYTNASSFSCPVHERYLFKIRPGSISHAAGPLFLYFWPDIGSAEREKSYAHHGAGLLV